MLIGAGFLQLLTTFHFGPLQVFIALGVTLAALAIALRATRAVTARA